MGWTTCFTASSWKTVGGRMVVDRRKECDKLYTFETKGYVTSRVLKSAMVGSTYYAAVEQVRKCDGKDVRVVVAGVCLTCGSGRDGTIWGYKDMTEEYGPNEDKCPASILALLTTIDSKFANEWRERCRKNIAMTAEQKKNGNKIYFPKGIVVKVERGSWIITSDEFVRKSAYSGVRYTKKTWHDFDRALRTFLHNHGTIGQRAEYAASGRECPKEWKIKVA